MSLNTKQKALVKDSRRAWWRGFRHSDMADDIRRRQLIDALESVLPEHSFQSGVINTGETRTNWETEDLSSPCDTIVYTGQPWEQLEEYVVVPSSDAHCVLEVESWLSDDDISRTGGAVNERVDRIKNETGLPVILVGFRHQEERETLVSHSVADRTFILASGENGDTADLIYEGELQKLVDTIERIIEF